MQIESEDLWPLILHFIKEHEGKKAAKTIQKALDIECEIDNDVLVKAGGLEALLTCFLKNNKNIVKQLKKQKSGQADSESEKDKKKKKKRKNSSGSEEPKKKRRRSSASSFHWDEPENFIAAPKRTEKKNNEDDEVNDYGVKKRWGRIDDSVADKITHGFHDNTFEAKAKYGEEGDNFGNYSNDRLKVTQGKSFRKEKGKMKNKNFHANGEKITNRINSVRFD